MRKIVMLLAVLVLVSMSAAAATNANATNHGSPQAIIETNTFDLTITTSAPTLAMLNAVSNADTRSANSSTNWVAGVAVRNRKTNHVDTLLAVDRSPEPVPLIRTCAFASGADKTVISTDAFVQVHLVAKHAAGLLDIDQRGFAQDHLTAAHARGLLDVSMRGSANEMKATAIFDFNDFQIANDESSRTRAPAELEMNSMPPYFSAV